MQDRRRRRELKAELVRDMSENVTSLVRFMQYIDIGAKPEAERQREESRLGFWIGDWERQVTLIWLGCAPISRTRASGITGSSTPTSFVTSTTSAG
jgi:hypothetical protein